MTSSAAKPRGLMRRYAPDLAIIAATFAFVAAAGLLGLWLIHGS